MVWKHKVKNHMFLIFTHWLLIDANVCDNHNKIKRIYSSNQGLKCPTISERNITDQPTATQNS